MKKIENEDIKQWTQHILNQCVIARTQMAVCGLLEITRPTLNRLLKDPLKLTIHQWIKLNDYWEYLQKEEAFKNAK